MHKVIIYNGKRYTTEARVPVGWTRAMAFGDGVFTTLLWRRGRLQHLPRHLQRLQRACSLLGLQADTGAWTESLRLAIQQLDEPLARVKLAVWRKGEGAYTPTGSAAAHIVLATALAEDPYCTGQPVRSVLTQLKVPVHPLSFSKTLSSLPYVLAAAEAQKAEVAHALLADEEGSFAETHMANLFFVQHNTLITPPGGVQGVVRQLLMENPLPGWKIIVGPYYMEQLSECQGMWLANSLLGLQPIAYVNDSDLPIDDAVLLKWQKHLLALCAAEPKFV